MHDTTLDRTTDGDGLVTARDFAYVQTLYSLGPDRKPTRHSVPLAVEVLELMVQQTGKTMVLDIKDDNDIEMYVLF